jgi:hypothetical protein
MDETKEMEKYSKYLFFKTCQVTNFNKFSHSLVYFDCASFKTVNYKLKTFTLLTKFAWLFNTVKGMTINFKEFRFSIEESCINFFQLIVQSRQGSKLCTESQSQPKIQAWFCLAINVRFGFLRTDSMKSQFTGLNPRDHIWMSCK